MLKYYLVYNLGLYSSGRKNSQRLVDLTKRKESFLLMECTSFAEKYSRNFLSKNSSFCFSLIALFLARLRGKKKKKAEEFKLQFL